MSARNDDDAPEPGSSRSALASLYFPCSGILMIIVGAVAWSLKGTGSVLEVFAFLLPCGTIVLIYSLVRLVRDAR